MSDPWALPEGWTVEEARALADWLEFTGGGQQFSLRAYRKANPNLEPAGEACVQSLEREAAKMREAAMRLRRNATYQAMRSGGR